MGARVAQSVYQRDEWPGFHFRQTATNLSLLHSVKHGPGAHLVSYPMGSAGSFLGVKQPGREADLSLPSIAEVKYCEAIPPLPHISSWYSA
jgi:hypothetical protein